MPAYNHARYLAAAIRSVQAQSFSTWELVICDDGSSDESAALAGSFAEADRRIRVITTSHVGEAAALGTAYAASRGQVVALLNDDDLFATNKLETCANALRRPRTGLVIHRLDAIDDGGQWLASIPPFSRLAGGWLGPSIQRAGTMWAPQLSSGLCFRRELADFVFPIPSGVADDTFICNILPLLTETAALEASLGSYRRHTGQFTHREAVGREMFVETLEEYFAVVESVNARLAAKGVAGVALSAGRSLTVRQMQFLLELTEVDAIHLGSVRPLAHLCLDLFRDPYAYPSVTRRTLQVAMLIFAWVIPRREREALFNLAMGDTLLKRSLSRRARSFLGRQRA
jgi:hypothetical protein